VIATLCDGALYLLVSEAILGRCPPTMHQFLQQTTLQRAQSAVQAQLLLLRWLLTEEILQIDNVMGTIFEDSVTLEDYATDYDAHMAIARYMAQTEPFYLGAHVMVLRGLLLHFINDALQGDDVLNHLQLIAPESIRSSSDALLTIEDILLLWIRGVLGLFTAELTSVAAKRIVQEINHVDDLYLHTNDGRVIALVVHHYKPSLIDLNLIHLATPLSMWERQENWTHIIRAAEALDVWVGVFADEMVAHGFVTLQQHLLRIVQDLFLVLACDAEEQYESARKAIEEEQLKRPQHEQPNTSLGSNTSELEGDTIFIGKHVMHSMMIGPSTPPPLLASEEDGMIDRKSTTLLEPPAHAQIVASFEMLTGNGDRRFDGVDAIQSRETIDTSADEGPASSDNAPVPGGGSGGNTIDGDESIGDVAHQHEDYNIVMTGLFLQGTSIPIRRQEQVAVEANELSMGRTGPIEAPQYVDVLPLATSSDEASPQAGPDITDAALQPPRSDSPVLVGRSMELRRQRREENAVASSVAYFRNMRRAVGPPGLHAPPATAAAATGLPMGENHKMRMSMVQGSMDADGIEALLKELVNIPRDPCDILRGAGGNGRGGNNAVDPLADAREQNHVLRFALDEQRRKVAALVEKFRRGVRKQEYAAIVKHLKAHKRQEAPTNEPVQSFTTMRRSTAAALPNISFAKSSGGDANMSIASRDAEAARCEVALRRSLEHGILQRQQQQQPERFVLSGVGAKCGALNDLSTVREEANAAAASSRIEPVLPMDSTTRPEVAKSARGGLALHFSTGGLSKAVVEAALGDSGAPPFTSKAAPSSVPPVVEDHYVHLPALEKMRSARKLSLSKGNRRQSETETVDDGSASMTSTLTNAVTTVAPVVVKTKNNKSVMVLAFKHVLLTGQLNKVALEKVLALVNDLSEEGNQFVILFKDEFTQQFKGLYTVRADAVLVRVYGSGPYMAYAGPQPTNDAESTTWTQGLPYLFPKFFKFDSGNKTFQQFSAKWVNQAADGVAFAAAKPKMMDRERF
jgi:hypothetical protein